MQTTPTSLVVIGARSPNGLRWLGDRFNVVPPRARALALRLQANEFDAVLWAERLRSEAHRAGVSVSIGVAEGVDGGATHATAEAAGHAFERAVALGGDITIAHSNLVRAA